MLNILINAYACSPNWGSEQGMAWNWILNLSKYCNLFIITEGEYKDLIEKALNKLPQKDNIHFYYNPVSEKIRKMCWNQGDWHFYYFYKRWQQSTYKIALGIIEKHQIDIIHQLNMIGFREPGYLWKIKEIPFIWGPIGGMETMPVSYLTTASFNTKLLVCIKNIINSYQVKYSIRVFNAINRADTLIAAVKGVKDKIEKYHNKEALLINETGCYLNEFVKEYKPNIEKETFDILWVGKFDFRKQLGLAIRTIAQVKDKLPGIKLHICGEGSRSEVFQYQSLSAELNVEDICIWYGKLSNTKVHELMKKFDLFFFTSIMEATSTVVLEAISNQLPVICFNTCGFGPLIDESIGRRIELSYPEKSIKDFANEICNLYNDRKLLYNMSIACIKKQEELSWDSKAKQMIAIYNKLNILHENKYAIKKSKY